MQTLSTLVAREIIVQKVAQTFDFAFSWSREIRTSYLSFPRRIPIARFGDRLKEAARLARKNKRRRWRGRVERSAEEKVRGREERRKDRGLTDLTYLLPGSGNEFV